MHMAVVGGGSAGWITALYAKKAYPSYTVTLIESEEYGILGAGEGGTPQLKDLLNFLGISVQDLILHCGSTIKSGIKFSNWQGKNDFFYHPFASNSLASNDSNFEYVPYLEADTSFAHLYAAKNNHSLSNYGLIHKISEAGKVPFVHEGHSLDSVYPLANWSIHFDAKALANFLRTTGESRGIVREEGIVDKISANEKGDITSLSIKGNKSIKVDFVFDCSGFRRLIIGNFYKSKWKSYSSYLPAKKAIPFFLSPEKDIKPYTESVAMKYGWMWKIHLQHRSGCGYVFDSNFISEDEAKKEVDALIGHEVESPRTFTFNPGCYEEVWINNCLAVGLASSFIEPLEATSMWQTVNTLKRFFRTRTNVTCKSKIEKDLFNKHVEQENQEYVNLIYLHYLTTRKDTSFWNDFSKNNTVPDFISYVLDIARTRLLTDDDIAQTSPFTFASYNYILVGNGLIDKSVLTKNLKYSADDKSVFYDKILSVQKDAVDNCMPHRQFLQLVRKK